LTQRPHRAPQAHIQKTAPNAIAKNDVVRSVIVWPAIEYLESMAGATHTLAKYALVGEIVLTATHTGQDRLAKVGQSIGTGRDGDVPFCDSAIRK
jgi:hypothetical protein